MRILRRPHFLEACDKHKSSKRAQLHKKKLNRPRDHTPFYRPIQKKWKKVENLMTYVRHKFFVDIIRKRPVHQTKTFILLLITPNFLTLNISFFSYESTVFCVEKSYTWSNFVMLYRFLFYSYIPKVEKCGINFLSFSVEFRIYSSRR